MVLAGHADEMLKVYPLYSAGAINFLAAGHDANFRRTQVFCGQEVASDAAVAPEILSKKPIGVGVRQRHGSPWAIRSA